MSWLTYRDNVLKTPAITRAVELMNPFFEGESSIITSGLRTPKDQLGIILQKTAAHSVDQEFPEFVLGVKEIWEVAKTVHIDDINKDLFWWQRAWSRCLNLGDIVNPPIPAEVIFSYVRPGDTKDKKGEIIQISPHQHGIAFDIGGENNLTEKAKRVMKASQSGECFIKSFLCEHINNAVHVDVLQIG